MYDALRAIRPYKKEFTHQDSVEPIYKESGISATLRWWMPSVRLIYEIRCSSANSYKTLGTRLQH